LYGIWKCDIRLSATFAYHARYGIPLALAKQLKEKKKKRMATTKPFPLNESGIRSGDHAAKTADPIIAVTRWRDQPEHQAGGSE
jgi:hypothetical protein